MSHVALNHRSSWDYEFEWTGSGTQTFLHNISLPLRMGKRAASIQILVGDAYVSAINQNDFSLAVTSSSGRGKFVPDVKVGDYT